MKTLYFSSLIATFLSLGVSANVNEINVESNTSFASSTTSVEHTSGSTKSLSTSTLP
ncbi:MULTISPECIES: hypothetical protein [unclassified Pseudoalteromonas]|uniref:hypothetical protein n=1 Tax=unclassified Pseudoalteromonas TaxID=194690 RepID=UPI0015FFA253|nr:MULTISPECIES: hypothetical protein [unclassified Pseudoalteromonas]MBB1332055.1 hypothetical protein [Pseudoalteromonas sp. SR41-6]MBB1457313.1 hypothetical protein [Pseudoalteromonas sp. SG41-8]MBB1470296.1 hypothetical protein [Pseudoalteromonas sp. SG41-5]